MTPMRDDWLVFSLRSMLDISITPLNPKDIHNVRSGQRVDPALGIRVALLTLRRINVFLIQLTCLR